MKVAVSMEFAIFVGLASGHLVKYSMTTIIYRFPCSVGIKGLTTSIPHLSKMLFTLHILLHLWLGSAKDTSSLFFELLLPHFDVPLLGHHGTSILSNLLLPLGL